MSGTTITGNSNTTNVILNSGDSVISETTTSSSNSGMSGMNAPNTLAKNFCTRVDVGMNGDLHGFKPAFALVQRDISFIMANPAGQGIHNIFPMNFDLMAPYLGRRKPGTTGGAAEMYGYPMVGGGDLMGLNYDVNWTEDRRFQTIEELDYMCGPHQSMRATIQIVGDRKFPSDGQYVRVIVPPECPLLAANLASAATAPGYNFGVTERMEVSANMTQVTFYKMDSGSGKWYLGSTMEWDASQNCYQNNKEDELKSYYGATNMKKNHLGTTWEFCCIGSNNDSSASGIDTASGEYLAANTDISFYNYYAESPAFANFASSIDEDLMRKRVWLNATVSMIGQAEIGRATPSTAKKSKEDMWYLQSHNLLSGMWHMGRNCGPEFSGQGFCDMSDAPLFMGSNSPWKDIPVPGNIYKVQTTIAGPDGSGALNDSLWL